MPDADNLEARVGGWTCSRIGADSLNRRERAMRLLEEATELAQAEGIPVDMVSAQVGHVYSRPAGSPSQEAGGVAVCLLGWCYSVGTTFSQIANAEVERIEAKPIEEIRGSLARKADADLVCCAATPENESRRIQLLLERNNIDLELRRKAEAERDALRESISDLTMARDHRVETLRAALAEASNVMSACRVSAQVALNEAGKDHA